MLTIINNFAFIDAVFKYDNYKYERASDYTKSFITEQLNIHFNVSHTKILHWGILLNIRKCTLLN